MKLISTYTVGPGGIDWITFSNIPQIYTDLLVLISVRSSVAGYFSVGLGILPNISNTEYPNLERSLAGTGSGVSSSTGAYRTIGTMPASNAPANTFNNASVYIPNYAASGTYKVMSGDSMVENTASQSVQYIASVKTSATSPITEISFGDSTSGANFVSNSTISLYGITKGAGGATVS